MLLSAMSYSIHFFNESVKAEIENWPIGINASFTRIAEQIEISGPNLGLPSPGHSVRGFLKSGPEEPKALGGHFSAAL